MGLAGQVLILLLTAASYAAGARDLLQPPHRPERPRGPARSARALGVRGERPRRQHHRRRRSSPASAGPSGDSCPGSEGALMAESGLVRGIGLRALTASIVNATVGAGIFVLPGAVALDPGGCGSPGLRDLRADDGPHRRVVGDGRQPGLAHRWPLRLRRGRLRTLRRISRRGPPLALVCPRRRLGGKRAGHHCRPRRPFPRGRPRTGRVPGRALRGARRGQHPGCAARRRRRAAADAGRSSCPSSSSSRSGSSSRTPGPWPGRRRPRAPLSGRPFCSSSSPSSASSWP